MAGCPNTRGCPDGWGKDSTEFMHWHIVGIALSWALTHYFWYNYSNIVHGMLLLHIWQ